MSHIVTAGKKFLDIDAFAGCIAYAELLSVQGVEASAVSTATINESVTMLARSLGSGLLSSVYTPDVRDEFVLVDVSEPDYIDTIVDQERITTIIDHHTGFEEYWRDRVADLEIEMIGAACTQVYERWQTAGLVDKMSRESALLLSMGILDNTLNFNAGVSTERDEAAYKHLVSLGAAPDNWQEQYFQDCESSILSNISTSLENDTKTMKFPGYADYLKVGQLVLWDASEVVDEVSRQVGQTGHFINVVSIREGRSYLLSRDRAVIQFLERILSVRFTGHMAVADRLWLRKEIMKAAIDQAQLEVHR